MAKQDLAFEHKVIQPLKAHAGQIWLLAVSGGVDSMVLAEVIFRWSRLLKVRLHVGHVHHGRKAPAPQKRFRDHAQKTVAEWCSARSVSFMTNEPEDVELKSEAALREYRQKHLKEFAARAGAHFIVYAHHLDDLLETRLLRLIRGTGPFGLRSMQLAHAGKMRPLLECSRAEIESYAALRAVPFCEDPSNKETGALRNWLRQTWLPLLEAKNPGAGRAMARSLELLCREEKNAVVEPLANVGLRREDIISLPAAAAEKKVAEYLRSLGLKNYGRAHVREILKRMDSPRKNPTFRMLGVVFQVTPDLFWASRV